MSKRQLARAPAPAIGGAIMNRTLRGTYANLIGLGVRFAYQVLLVPLYLTAWGNRGFGDWLVLTSATAYLSLADVGVQTYFVNRMNAAWNLRNKREFHILLHSALAFYATQVAAIGLLLLLAANRIPWRAAFHLSVTTDRLAATVISISGFAMLLATPAMLILGVYRCVGEYARGVGIANATQAANVALTAIVLAFGAGLEYVAALLLIPPVLNVVLALLDLGRRHRDIEVGFRLASIRLLRQSIKKSSFFVLIPFSQALWLQGVLIAISVVLGSAALVSFSVTRTVFLVVRQLLNQVIQAASPEITVLFARRDLVRLSRLHTYLNQFSVELSAAAVGYLAFMCPVIVTVWTSGRVKADFASVWLFGLYILSASLWSGSYIVPVSVNRHHGVSVAFLLMAASTVLLTLVLAPHLGIAGAGVALVLGDAWLVVWVCGASSRLLGQPIRRGWGSALSGGALMLTAVGSSMAAVSAAFSVTAFTNLAVASGVALVAASSLALWLVPEAERRRMFSIVRASVRGACSGQDEVREPGRQTAAGAVPGPEVRFCAQPAGSASVSKDR